MATEEEAAPAPAPEEEKEAAKEEATETTQAEEEGKEEAAEKADEAKEKAAPKEESKKGSSKDSKGKKNGKAAAEEVDPMDAIVEMMEERQFPRAAAELSKLLKKNPEDPIMLHNLGCVYTELEKWEPAEEAFTQAYEAQKKDGKYNDATLFGLATVLAEQGGMGKLLQSEALLRDCLDRAIAKEDHGIMETFRSFQALADCLGKQKRWGEASEAYEQAFRMSSHMYPEDHACNKQGKFLLERSQRLAKIQKMIRIGLWTATAAVPIFCAYMWNYVGGPSVGELFSMMTGSNITDAAPSAIPGSDLPDLSSLDIDAPPRG
mmetsp:Transcript_2275/g.2992  ORF Transcript_2275/g.2992 Transcript_2275/m.2992 type:complete len:320 (-) Transcript_2275:147-1106(-)|eukprot:CAMPEP_0194753522 /NCGR_PEP_ID=MMETSP0323_2-20130528/7460_1 /TAXON_ID=2866 ORGANISM="Crypthecodinium cohnii, Strain Seligo" /NCGR_SAMPLE_ID=MMETSP0323_2 /ASSEMBLY_ACC=CAM_ASM_000346 /LENGTH=319 /DNA_ID=CAMNT_0039671413 /DNA_START=86 /DNA_END=1045 /DNA_ORIENTATION=+